MTTAYARKLEASVSERSLPDEADNTCELCKISYATSPELKEHFWSLMHHIKLEGKNKNSEHKCTLCLTAFKNLIEYGKHLNEDKHKKALDESRKSRTIREEELNSVIVSLEKKNSLPENWDVTSSYDNSESIFDDSGHRNWKVKTDEQSIRCDRPSIPWGSRAYEGDGEMSDSWKKGSRNDRHESWSKGNKGLKNRNNRSDRMPLEHINDHRFPNSNDCYQRGYGQNRSIDYDNQSYNNDLRGRDYGRYNEEEMNNSGCLPKWKELRQIKPNECNPRNDRPERQTFENPFWHSDVFKQPNQSRFQEEMYCDRNEPRRPNSHLHFEEDWNDNDWLHNKVDEQSNYKTYNDNYIDFDNPKSNRFGARDTSSDCRTAASTVNTPDNSFTQPPLMFSTPTGDGQDISLRSSSNSGSLKRRWEIENKDSELDNKTKRISRTVGRKQMSSPSQSPSRDFLANSSKSSTSSNSVKAKKMKGNKTIAPSLNKTDSINKNTTDVSNAVCKQKETNKGNKSNSKKVSNQATSASDKNINKVIGKTKVATKQSAVVPAKPKDVNVVLKKDISAKKTENSSKRDLGSNGVPFQNQTNKNNGKNNTAAPEGFKKKFPKSDLFSKSAKSANKGKNVVEKAEALCQELREKRDSKAKEGKNLLKQQQKKNSLPEKHQNNMKKSTSSESSEQNIVAHAPIKVPDTVSVIVHNVPLNEKVKPMDTNSVTKTLASKKLTSSKVTDSTTSKASTKPSKADIERIRSYIEGSTFTNPNSDSSVEVHAHPISASPGKNYNRSSHDLLGKESLLKMVNSPRSRKERVKLAEMIRTHAKSQNKFSQSRFSLNGIFDTFSGSEPMQELNIQDLPTELQLQIAQIMESDMISDTDSSKTSSFFRGSVCGDAAMDVDESPVATSVHVSSDPVVENMVTSTADDTKLSRTSRNDSAVIKKASTTSTSGKSTASAGENTTAPDVSIVKREPDSQSSLDAVTSSAGDVMPHSVDTEQPSTSTEASGHRIGTNNQLDSSTSGPDAGVCAVNAFFHQVFQITLKEGSIRKEVSEVDERIAHLRKIIEESTAQLRRYEEKRSKLVMREEHLRAERLMAIKAALDVSRSQSTVNNDPATHGSAAVVMPSTSCVEHTSLSASERSSKKGSAASSTSKSQSAQVSPVPSRLSEAIRIKQEPASPPPEADSSFVNSGLSMSDLRIPSERNDDTQKSKHKKHDKKLSQSSLNDDQSSQEAEGSQVNVNTSPPVTGNGFAVRYMGSVPVTECDGLLKQLTQNPDSAKVSCVVVSDKGQVEQVMSPCTMKSNPFNSTASINLASDMESFSEQPSNATGSQSNSLASSKCSLGERIKLYCDYVESTETSLVTNGHRDIILESSTNQHSDTSSPNHRLQNCSVTLKKLDLDATTSGPVYLKKLDLDATTSGPVYLKKADFLSCAKDFVSPQSSVKTVQNVSTKPDDTYIDNAKKKLKSKKQRDKVCKTDNSASKVEHAVDSSSDCSTPSQVSKKSAKKSAGREGKKSTFRSEKSCDETGGQSVDVFLPDLLSYEDEDKVSNAKREASSKLKLKLENVQVLREAFKKSKASDAALKATYMPPIDPNNRPMPVSSMQVFKEHLYVCYNTMTVSRFNVKSQELAMTYECSTDVIHDILATDTGGHGDRLFTCGQSSVLNALDIESGSPSLCLELDDKLRCLHENKNMLYIGMANGNVAVMNLRGNKIVNDIRCSFRPVTCISSGMEGGRQMLCVGTQDSSINVCDAKSGVLLRTLDGHTKAPLSIQVQGHLVYSGSADKSVIIHNLNTGAVEWSFTEHKGIVTCICIHNNTLLSAGYDKYIRCFNRQSYRPQQMYYGSGWGMITAMIEDSTSIYTGNRAGVVEAMVLTPDERWKCKCDKCRFVFGSEDHLLHHILAEHLLVNTKMKCTWKGCSTMINTKTDKEAAARHIQSHLSEK